MLLDVTAKTTKLSLPQSYNAVTSVLIDKGFDIKMANKDIGLITTEYKRFASVEGSPPFDLYLKIKITIRQGNDGKVHIKLIPKSKDVNRLNSAAWTEHELYVLTEEQQSGYLNAVQSAFQSGQIMFMNVVSGVAEVTGLGLEDLEYSEMLSDR